MVSNKVNEYSEKLNAIRNVSTVRRMALAIDCTEQTIQNWLKNPASIKVGKLDAIDNLYDEVMK